MNDWQSGKHVTLPLAVCIVNSIRRFIDVKSREKSRICTYFHFIVALIYFIQSFYFVQSHHCADIA